MIIKGSKPDWIKTPAAPVVAVVWDMCWPAATLHPQQRVCCSLSDVDGWCSDEPAVRTLNLLHCNVLVLPRTTPVLKSIPLISHTDSNRTAHSSRVKQSHICFFHKLFLYCWYHAAHSSFLAAVSGTGGTFLPAPSYGSVYRLYWRRTTNAF